KFSVVSNSDYKESGFGAETIGWQIITGETGGSFYDIEADDFSEMLMSINYDINDEMNDKIDDYENTGNIIADVKKRLNALVNVMFREINKLHSSGKTLDEGEGKDFFTAIDDSLPLQIGNIQTNPSFTSLNNIVASYTDKNGDNNVAFSIANIRNSKILGDKSGSLSVDDFYQAIVLTVGTEAAEISRVYENQSDLTKSANDFRKSITDVSMDEEMSNMIRYKYAYSASSRLINVIDEMIETILTKIGN
ncbi:MAG: flagellar basal body rod C-terminal domain-containing protein, partial [Clostridiales bacterium]